MGRELYECFPVFAEAFDACCEELDPHLGRSLKELVFEDEGESLERTELTQASLFALEVALFRLFSSWGVKADFLIGHSIGELVAAHVAGVFSLREACQLVAARGRLMGALPQGGGMLAIEASEDEVRTSLDGFEDRLAVAAVNGPAAVVVSGDLDALEGWSGRWDRATTKRLHVSHAFHSPRMDAMLDQFRAVAEQLELKPPRIPIVSNLTGELAGAELCSPEYWVRHIRETVRFRDGVRSLQAAGATHFLELGPDAVLSALASHSVTEEAIFATALRKGRPETDTILGALSALHVHGIDIDWSAQYTTVNPRRVGLPTYPFQRERYWLDPAHDAGNIAAAGLVAAEHPLLGATVQVAGEDRCVFTGRLSLETHPWLADHMVLDTVILPGTAFLELALHAGASIHAKTVDELTLHAPLILEEHSGVIIQVSVGEPDDQGRREITIFSRPDIHDGEEHEWTRHATGQLSPKHDSNEAEVEYEWPPANAEPIMVDDLYDRLADVGFTYGPIFQGLQTAWRHDEQLFAEITLPDDQTTNAQHCGIHPALLDAALHTLGLVEPDALGLPFAWRGVRLYSGGACSLRARLVVGDGAVSVAMWTEAGTPVASVDSLALRPFSKEQLATAGGGRGDADDLFGVEWVEVAVASPSGSARSLALLGEPEALQIGADGLRDLDGLVAAFGEDGLGPRLVVAEVADGDRGGGLSGVAHGRVERTLELLQAWLADERLADSRLVLLTSGAVVACDGESPDLAAAAVWGLVRSAQSEHPGRFTILDSDGTTASADALLGALASDEPQLVLREGRVHAPRLTRTRARREKEIGAGDEAGEHEVDVAVFDPDGTVLITGGTGGLGGLLSHHLAQQGARHLLLLSRRGPGADGADQLIEELAELGCQTSVIACDATDREALAEVIAAIPPERALTGVVHAAGVLDDGMLESLNPERIERVMRPKVDAAINLHELTKHLPLSMFVLFSSMAGILGSPGQGNYAAANAFLDALAQHRHTNNLPGLAIAWGLWAQTTGMSGELTNLDLARLRGAGMLALSAERGLALFDTALASGEPLLVAAPLDRRTLRTHAQAGMLPPLLSSLVPRTPNRSPDRTGSLARRLASVPEEDRDALVLEIVLNHVAAVLGHSTPNAIPTNRAFKDLGFDSLSAVELRNRLAQTTGLRLPSTLIFDHPTPTALATHLHHQTQQTTHNVVDRELDRLDAALSSASDEQKQLVMARLTSLITKLAPTESPANGATTVELIESASADEIFDLIDHELGQT
jgi:acyl transferase domain-containing protein/acyl carrier protein